MRLIDADAKEPYLLDGRYVVNPLVRCKDCKHCNTDWAMGKWYGSCKEWNTHSVMADWYCVNGERKDNG